MIALAAAVASIYAQTAGFSFIVSDDDLYVSDNPWVLSGLSADGISWAFTTFHASNWHPLTWLSHMADVELFGPSPGAAHLVNALLHLLNAELLLLVLWRMTDRFWPSALAAALFAVHPLHVESVAWIAERKDVLSTLFWLLAMAAYAAYVRRPATGRYLLVAAVFALGLMCKAMLVTLPFVLLLLDGWPLGRLVRSPSGEAPSLKDYLPSLSRLALEKIPLLALSAIDCVVTILAQSEGLAIRSIVQIPFSARASNALVACATYLGKAFWPSGLSPFYPHPALGNGSIPFWEPAGAALLLGGATVLFLRLLPRRPYLAVGWFWYLGTLVPVIGLVQVGVQSMADRYTYVPLVGIFVAASWAFFDAIEARGIRRAAIGGAVAVLLALSAAAWTQTGYWRDSFTVVSRALSVTENNAFAHYLKALSFVRTGNHRQAVVSYREALRIDPRDGMAWNNLGVSYDELGDPVQAIECYRRALQVKPDDTGALSNMGLALARLGRYGEAVAVYGEALRIDPADPLVWENLGAVFARMGRAEQAFACRMEARRLKGIPAGAP